MGLSLLLKYVIGIEEYVFKYFVNLLLARTVFQGSNVMSTQYARSSFVYTMALSTLKDNNNRESKPRSHELFYTFWSPDFEFPLPILAWGIVTIATDPRFN